MRVQQLRETLHRRCTLADVRRAFNAVDASSHDLLKPVAVRRALALRKQQPRALADAAGLCAGYLLDPRSADAVATLLGLPEMLDDFAAMLQAGRSLQSLRLTPPSLARMEDLAVQGWAARGAVLDDALMQTTTRVCHELTTHGHNPARLLDVLLARAEATPARPTAAVPLDVLYCSLAAYARFQHAGCRAVYERSAGHFAEAASGRSRSGGGGSFGLDTPLDAAPAPEALAHDALAAYKIMGLFLARAKTMRSVAQALPALFRSFEGVVGRAEKVGTMDGAFLFDVVVLYNKARVFPPRQLVAQACVRVPQGNLHALHTTLATLFARQARETGPAPHSRYPADYALMVDRLLKASDADVPFAAKAGVLRDCAAGGAVLPDGALEHVAGVLRRRTAAAAAAGGGGGGGGSGQAAGEPVLRTLAHLVAAAAGFTGRAPPAFADAVEAAAREALQDAAVGGEGLPDLAAAVVRFLPSRASAGGSSSRTVFLKMPTAVQARGVCLGVLFERRRAQETGVEGAAGSAGAAEVVPVAVAAEPSSGGRLQMRQPLRVRLLEAWGILTHLRHTAAERGDDVGGAAEHACSVLPTLVAGCCEAVEGAGEGADVLLLCEILGEAAGVVAALRRTKAAQQPEHLWDAVHEVFDAIDLVFARRGFALFVKEFVSERHAYDSLTRMLLAACQVLSLPYTSHFFLLVAEHVAAGRTNIHPLILTRLLRCHDFACGADEAFLQKTAVSEPEPAADTGALVSAIIGRYVQRCAWTADGPARVESLPLQARRDATTLRQVDAALLLNACARAHVDSQAVRDTVYTMHKKLRRRPPAEVLASYERMRDVRSW